MYMGEVKKCPNCGNLQARGNFCSQCGVDISKVGPFIEDYAPQLGVRSSSNDYGTLRFVADFFVFLGWLEIIATVILVCLILSSAAGFNAIVNQGGGGPVAEVIGMSGVVGAVILLFAGTTVGLGGVAFGQLIMVFLDIRDDVRKLVNKGL